jgi:DNA-binding CsgD family transcriptional regulator
VPLISVPVFITGKEMLTASEERVEKSMGNGYTNQEVAKIKGERPR